MTALRITDDSTPEAIAEALGHMSKAAQAEQRIVARYTTDEPTPWDSRHVGLNLLLTDYERAKARQPA